jgi:penicillin-binding protein 1C
MKARRLLRIALALSLLGLAALALLTWLSLRPLPASLPPGAPSAGQAVAPYRAAWSVAASQGSDWNLHHVMPLREIPTLLREAFITAEDRRFYSHHGPDWTARLAAVFQNLRAGRPVRGASTITEQAVRLLHRRPRSVWARWLEGWEARRLESRFDKDEILEFYLNQVPYARRCRGVAPAAREFFGRELDTLSPKETLALAVMVRAPVRLDPRVSPAALERSIGRLADRMLAAGLMTESEWREARRGSQALVSPLRPIAARQSAPPARARAAEEHGTS